MEVFWITAWKPLATAKLALKSILKPGKKAKFTPVTPQGGGAKEVEHSPWTVEQLQQLEVPPSCGGITIQVAMLLDSDYLPKCFWVIGPHWPEVLPLPKVREWSWSVSYYSKRFGMVVRIDPHCYHGISFDSSLLFWYGASPHDYYTMKVDSDISDTSSSASPEDFHRVVEDWIGEFDLQCHPSVKSCDFKSVEDDSRWNMFFHNHLPRWLEDADPAYPVWVRSSLSYASANAALISPVANVYEDAAEILQHAKDHPLPGEYTEYFYEISSPTWAQREKRRKKLKDDATEIEKLGTPKLENGVRGEASLLMGKRGYRFYLTFDNHPEDAIRFPDTELFKAMKWQLG